MSTYRKSWHITKAARERLIGIDNHFKNRLAELAWATGLKTTHEPHIKWIPFSDLSKLERQQYPDTAKDEDWECRVWVEVTP